MNGMQENEARTPIRFPLFQVFRVCFEFRISSFEFSPVIAAPG